MLNMQHKYTAVISIKIQILATTISGGFVNNVFFVISVHCLLLGEYI